MCLESGQPVSEVYKEQHGRRDTPDQAFERKTDDEKENDILVFWTHAQTSKLNERLEHRVDHMIANGLTKEVEDLHELLTKLIAKGQIVDESHGIWTAIGYKEFLPWLTHDSRSETVKADCVERTKIATKQYAKRQNRWIRLTLIPGLARSGSEGMIYLLDASEQASFVDNVQGPAIQITISFINGDTLPDPSGLSDLAADCLQLQTKPNIEARHCEVCEKTLMTEDQWIGHLKSKGHRSASRPKVDWKALYANSKHP